MRIFIIIIISLFTSCKQKSKPQNTAVQTDKINVEKLEQEGFNVYQESPAAALKIFKVVASEYEKNENYKKAGLTNLNIANIYDEHIHNLDSAIYYSQYALHIWQTQKDTLQMANLLKYLGLLKGRNGQFSEAKATIQKAILHYEDIPFQQGVAVSKINLADTYFREKDYPNALKYYNQSTDFWWTQNERSRIYTNNILGIQILYTMNESKKAQHLIEENSIIEQEVAINDYAKNKFSELIIELNKDDALEF